MSAVESTAASRLSRRVQARQTVLSTFLKGEQERIARICFDMARAFSRGATLIAYGTGPGATDAAHVAVEFMHPVIVGKRALPALALSNDPSGAGRQPPLTRAGDIALGLSHSHSDPEIERWLIESGRRGLLTIGFGAAPPPGGQPSLPGVVDHALIVPSGDPLLVQEVQETTYHVLWELVHVFFERPGLLSDACITCGDVAVPAQVVATSGSKATIEKDGVREEIAIDLLEDVSAGDVLLCHAGVALEKVPERFSSRPPDEGRAEDTSFLYPFLDSVQDDLEAVLADVQSSTLQKGRDVSALRGAIDVGAVERCAQAIHPRLQAGGRLITFGNGGSSTDAQDLATDALNDGWPAIALTNDPATVTAVGNDVGFDKVFSRQLIPLARPQDIALGISTSGSSANVVAGLEEAHRRHMLTCAITGYDGGRLAALDCLDHLFVVQGDYIPRLQEAHATIYHLLLEAIAGR